MEFYIKTHTNRFKNKISNNNIKNEQQNHRSPPSNNKKLKINKVYKFESLDKIPYSAMKEYNENLLRLVISRTDKNLIKFNKKRVFFCHPIFTNFGCDFHCDVYDLIHLNQPRIYSFKDIINIGLYINKEYYPIKYKYSKFVNECIK